MFPTTLTRCESTADERQTGPTTRRAVAATAGVVSLGTLLLGIGGLGLGVDWAWIAFPVGYGGVLPLAIALARTRASGASDTDGGGKDPLATLRDRYARGEIGDEEFERRLERLLESEPDEGGWD
ncbi:SHOCT domain-containing protein [Halomicroarcula sp. GCM10025817]|uniref:SHOCT domain-containing protein n=1 Tax=Haloarcula TaxID=2237 RepID=UPI0023E7E692|nr:SHOCT domain-containing protein [Halomicroarcula sp. SYNS111]